MDSLGRALTFLFIAVGAGIFLIIVSIKVDMITKKAYTQVKQATADSDWESYLYHQAIQEVVKTKGNEKQ